MPIKKIGSKTSLRDWCARAGSHSRRDAASFREIGSPPTATALARCHEVRALDSHQLATDAPCSLRLLLVRCPAKRHDEHRRESDHRLWLEANVFNQRNGQS